MTTNINIEDLAKQLAEENIKIILPNGYEFLGSGLFVHISTPCDTYVLCANNSIENNKLMLKEFSTLTGEPIDWEFLAAVEQAINDENYSDKQLLKKAEQHKHISLDKTQNKYYFTGFGHSLVSKLYLHIKEVKNNE